MGKGKRTRGEGFNSYLILMTFIKIQYDIDCNCIVELECSFALALLIFNYSMNDLLICKYEPLLHEASEKPLIHM